MIPSSWQVAPILGVRDVRQAAEYYRDVLGFTLDPVDGVFQPSPAEAGGVYAIVTRPGASIHFQIRRGETPERVRQPHERDVYIYVDHLDDLYTDLLGRGAVITHGPRLTPYGIREFEVEDPNGFRLAFGEFA